MAMMNVLSSSNMIQVGSKEKSSVKGDKANTLTDSAAAEFAAIFSNLVSTQIGSKGQDTGGKLENQDKEDKTDSSAKIKGNDLQMDVQAMSGLSGSLQQILIQANIPAGKDANSGSTDSQEINMLTVSSSTNLKQNFVVTNNKLSQTNDDLLTKVFDQTGMQAQEPQGSNSPNLTELDKYKQTILTLLSELNGEIKELSPQISKVNKVDLKTFNELKQLLSGIIDQVGETNQQAKQQINKILNVLSGDSELTGEESFANTDTTGSKLKAVEANINDNEPKVKVNVKADQNTVNSLSPSTKNNEELSSEVKIETDKNSTKFNLDNANEVQNKQQSSASLMPNNTQGLKNLKEENLTRLINESKSTNSSDSFTEKDLAKNDLQIKNSGGNSTKTGTTSTENTITQTNVSNKSNSENSSTDLNNLNLNSSNNIAQQNAVNNMNQGQPKSDQASVVGQIAAALNQNIQQDRHEVKEFSIQLHPEDLGKVQVYMRWDNGNVHLQVHAADAQTGNLIQNHLADLRQALESSGVSCGMLQMGLGGKNQQQNRQFGQNHHLYQNDNGSEAEKELMIENNYSVWNHKGDYQLNVTA